MNNTEILYTALTDSAGSLCRHDELRCAAEAILSGRDDADQSRFDSGYILGTCGKYFASLQDEPEEGWPLHCYRYVLNTMFPHLDGPSDPERYAEGRALSLGVLRGAYEYERLTMRFDPTRDFALLSDEEVIREGFTDEYIRMRRLVRQHYVYEFMRIGTDITPFNTLGHVAGVHYVATYAGRQLRESGVPVDLALLSGAAASHDIGKYGCRKSEERRVPYLHYYYTDYCMNRFGMPGIAHIGANHSTWDLELENLSAESLLLIYADFRVKSSRDADGREIIHFYTLAEAFDVILGKLDNVDAAKRHRYEKVYSRLKDFEDYMTERGVITDMPEEYCLEDGVITALPEDGAAYRQDAPVREKKEIALLRGDDVIEQMRFRAVDHNLRLMNRFNDPKDFASLLESARSETDWLNRRTYMSIFGEYSTYMTVEQKEMVLRFLYDRLSDRASDIREQAAVQMGEIISDYRETYKKELPADIPQPDVTQTNLGMFDHYLEKFVHPSDKLVGQHRRRIIQSTDFFVLSVIRTCRPQYRERYLAVLAKYYSEPCDEEYVAMALLHTALMMDEDMFDDPLRRAAAEFARKMIGTISGSVDLIALDVLEHCLGDEDGAIRVKRMRTMGIEDSGKATEEILESMFLDDLKFQTGWTYKAANIKYMMDTADSQDVSTDTVHRIASHLVNLIKVSETVTVRKTAGRALLSLIGRMSVDQRNDIMTELRSGLEIEDYQFSRFIPEFLGRFIVCLPENEYDEAVDDLVTLIYQGSTKTASAALITISIAIENFAVFTGGNDSEKNELRLKRLTGLLMKGAAHYNRVISQEAVHAAGEHIFASSMLTLEEKREAAGHIIKRMLTLIPDDGAESSLLEFYSNAAVLSMIYRFLSEYRSEAGEFGLAYKDKAAFFPGTFDPFSLGHKEIARSIRDMGFEVYLAIDEFSWSKKTLPHMFRREILSMSIADEEDMYIFPDDIQINIANNDDLRILKSLCEGRELYIAVGSDVVENASAYRNRPAPCSIHSFNHICFAREARVQDEDVRQSYPISGDVTELKLGRFYEDISSTRIRENIDLGRDISNLIDPVAQGYIYRNNFYTREPAYKHEVQAREISISTFEHRNYTAIESLRDELVRRGSDYETLHSYAIRPRVRTVYIESGQEDRHVSAFACSRRIERQDLLYEFGDSDLTASIRSRANGAIGVIGAIYSEPGGSVSDLMQIMLTELMSDLIAHDYGYVIYHPVSPDGMGDEIIETLERQGFVNIASEGEAPVYAVDTTAPVVIFKDVETVIKAPLNKNPRVQQAVEDAHDRLLRTFSRLYPGNLILSFNTSAVYSKIVDLVAEENGVSTVPDPARRRGPYMAVPFGKALSDVVVPNTVTKALRTEKYFNSSITAFRISEPHGYLSLEDQARMMKSFGRPVILIDDLLHSGMRMQQIDPILRKHDVDVKKVIVGLLTGNARDNMIEKRRDVEGAYYLPSIRLWLNERDCYPFIGGDSIDRDDAGSGQEDAPSINMILPYTSFSFAGGNDMDRVFEFSMTCLENARDIMRVLEEEYQAEFEKQLTLRRLGAVITHPRRPLCGDGLEYDGNLPPSRFIESDIRQAERLHLVRGKTRLKL